jgi:hypothetical protein
VVFKGWLINACVLLFYKGVASPYLLWGF